MFGPGTRITRGGGVARPGGSLREPKNEPLRETGMAPSPQSGVKACWFGARILPGRVLWAHFPLLPAAPGATLSLLPRNGHCKLVREGKGCSQGTRLRHYYMLCGSLLRVWSRIASIMADITNTSYLQIVRLKTKEKKKQVGEFVGGSTVGGGEPGRARTVGQRSPGRGPQEWRRWLFCPSGGWQVCV